MDISMIVFVSMATLAFGALVMVLDNFRLDR